MHLQNFKSLKKIKLQMNERKIPHIIKYLLAFSSYQKKNKV